MCSSSLRDLSAVVAAACSLLVCGCAPSGDGRAVVSVSLPVVGGLVERLTDQVEVNVMIPAGSDHDSYSPRPSQLARLEASRLYLALGPLEFEQQWRPTFAANAPGMRWIDLSQGVELLGGSACHAHGEAHADPRHGEVHADPHYWLSPASADRLARNMAAALRSLLPGQQQRIDSALNAVSHELRAFDARLERARGRAFAIYHPALAYVARDYGLRQLAIGNEGSGASPATYARLVDQARADSVTVLFVQRGYSPETVRHTAEEIGARLVALQPEQADLRATLSSLCNALAP